MKFVALDLELTHAPGGKIIQVGAVIADTQTMKIDETFDWLVNPHEPLSTDIMELCKLSQSQVDGAPELEEVLWRFWAIVGGKPVMAWGDDVDWLCTASEPYADMRLLQHMQRMERLDLRAMCAFMRQALPTNDGRKRGGLVPTLENFGLKFYGRQHDAMWDAYNTARLGLRLLDVNRRGLAVEVLGKAPPISERLQ